MVFRHVPVGPATQRLNCQVTKKWAIRHMIEIMARSTHPYSAHRSRRYSAVGRAFATASLKPFLIAAKRFVVSDAEAFRVKQ
jgi:hypothetical protein